MLNLHLLECTFKGYDHISDLLLAKYWVITGCKYRIYNNRHYINDVVAGACVGILSTKFAYWLYPKLFKKSVCNQGFVVGMPYFSNESAGLNLVAVFWLNSWHLHRNMWGDRMWVKNFNIKNGKKYHLSVSPETVKCFSRKT